jgi:hypothetical protein
LPATPSPKPAPNLPIIDIPNQNPGWPAISPHPNGFQPTWSVMSAVRTLPPVWNWMYSPQSPETGKCASTVLTSEPSLCLTAVRSWPVCRAPDTRTIVRMNQL